MIGFQPAFLQQLLNIPERQRISKIPADRTENERRFCLPPLEDRRSRSHLTILSRCQPDAYGSCNTTLGRFKTRIREVTRRPKSVSIKSTIEELAPYMRGWRSYFGFCETPEVLVGLTRWVRLRLRSALWRQWKTPRRRRAALLQLGVRPRLASNTAGSGLGPWYLARAKALSVGLSNVYFKSLGLPSLADESSRNLSNRRVRTRMHGGVAGVGG